MLKLSFTLVLAAISLHSAALGASLQVLATDFLHEASDGGLSDASAAELPDFVPVFSFASADAGFFSHCSPAGRKRFNVSGAPDAVTHELIAITDDTYINALCVCGLLKKIAEQIMLSIRNVRSFGIWRHPLILNYFICRLILLIRILSDGFGNLSKKMFIFKILFGFYFIQKRNYGMSE